ncbi:MAG TPA: sigma-70 family RNA polymerase sigma factor [Gemmataceae bacterium]|nr:sigma-70 family RNA polymerase sigma factor [Gemmataceae bacterium]
MYSTPVSLLDQLRHSPAQTDWARFVQLYTPLLFYWARKLGLKDADAADLVQDIFTVLVQKLPTFQYDQERGFRSWLRTVLLNRWRNLLRKQANARMAGTQVNLDAFADAELPDALAEEEYRQHLLSHALDLMRREFPEKTWKACWEHVVMGRSAADVAAELGIVPGAVYVAKSRVLARVRQDLKGMLE